MNNVMNKIVIDVLIQKVNYQLQVLLPKVRAPADFPILSINFNKIEDLEIEKDMYVCICVM